MFQDLFRSRPTVPEDRSATPGEALPAALCIALEVRDYQALRGLLLLDPESRRVIDGARLRDDVVLLQASPDDLEMLRECVLLEATLEHERARRTRLLRAHEALTPRC